MILDFSEVEFATRGFVDEFYNVSMKSSELLPFKLEITNVPEDINKIIEAMSHTQTRTKTISDHAPARFLTFKTVDELGPYLSSINVG